MNCADGRWLLAVDAGGSSTTALLAGLGADGWALMGRGSSGPGNPVACDLTLALESLDAAIDAAFRDAGRARAPVDSACLAIAGVDRSSARTAVEQWAESRQVGQECMIVHDAAPLLARVPADESAIALICGTGSFAWGRDAQGNTARAGGWGPALGDEGSGYWIGLIGLRAVLRAVDGRGPATSLTQSLAGLLEMSDWSELPARFRTFSRERLAALAPHVIAAAQARDAVARALLHEAGRQLAEIVLAVSTSLQCRGSLGRLVMAGSVLLQSQTLRRQVVQWLEQHGLDIRHVEQVAEPAEGALELARQALTR